MAELKRPIVGVQAIVTLGVGSKQILLGQRLGIFGEGTWGLPGGHLEFGESIEKAAVRELFEETGLKAIQPRTVTSVNTPYKATHYVQFGVEMTRFSGQVINREPDKCASLQFFPLDSLPSPLFPPSVEIIEFVKKRASITQPYSVEPSLSIYMHKSSDSKNEQKYAVYHLMENGKAFVVRSGRQGERGDRRVVRRVCDGVDEALLAISTDVAFRIRKSYQIYDVFSSLPLDLIRKIFPVGAISFRSAGGSEQGAEKMSDLIADRDQLPLFS